MKSGKLTKCDQVGPNALRLHIESDGEDTFNPDGNALDFLTLQVLSDVLGNTAKSRFSLKFFDADQVFFGKRRVRVNETVVKLETDFQSGGFVRVPLTCKIVDAFGRTSERILSEEDTRKWVSAPSFDGSYIDGDTYCTKSSKRSETPNFSPEVYLILNKMLLVSAARKLAPPLTIEIRDAEGRLVQAAEVQFNEHKYQTRTDLADCADLSFPVTVKLISRSGVELTETVQRQQ
jgi:hypothetical protein